MTNETSQYSVSTEKYASGYCTYIIMEVLALLSLFALHVILQHKLLSSDNMHLTRVCYNGLISNIPLCAVNYM